MLRSQPLVQAANLALGVAPVQEQHSQFFNAASSLQTEVNGQARQVNNTMIEGADDNERTGLLQIYIPPIEAIQTVDRRDVRRQRPQHRQRTWAVHLERLAVQELQNRRAHHGGVPR